ncbi:MAG: EVE domain-containing protein, partial [Lachnospira sp.]|nr:EVE domain-containing protein [Lachnospira sp.]
RVQCVQFHQSYSYEDFIEGYRPLEDGGFELRDGVFKKFCDKASRNTDKEYFFIIDEINRGNMSKIFGELLMLIESDKRGNSHYLNLVYSNEPFFVPENLHIIGMMNTADRSLAMIDYALRRRFSFYSMKPAFDSDGFKKHAEQVNCELFHKAIEAVKNLNAVIVDDKSLGKGFEIGHSYFCTNKPESITDEIVKNIIAFEIIPTIEEYWFDNETRLDTESQKLETLLGDDNGAI